MIKKSVFEDELIAGMHQQLIKQATQKDFDHLEKAAEYLNSAAEIFEDLGLTRNADEVLAILYKIAEHHHDEPGSDHGDMHTRGLTSEKMTGNLSGHGHVLNMEVDDNLSDLDINDALEVSEKVPSDIHDFEDERD